MASLNKTNLWKVRRLEGKSEETLSRRARTESALEFKGEVTVGPSFQDTMKDVSQYQRGVPSPQVQVVR